jgi:hypothetical protein
MSLRAAPASPDHQKGGTPAWWSERYFFVSRTRLFSRTGSLE